MEPSSIGWRDRALAHGMAALAGVLYVLAFPGFDLWPLGFFALVPLFHALELATSARRALALGFSFGATTQAFGFAWLLPTLRVFSALPAPASALVFGLICGYQAGLSALFALFVWLAKRRAPGAWLLVAPLLWAGLELVYPMLFPNYFAATLHRVPRFLQLADLGGPALCSLWLVAMNAAVYAAARAVRRERERALRALGAAALLIAVADGYGAWREAELTRVLAHAKKLRVGIVQVNMPRLEKRAARAEGRRRHLEQSVELERGLAEGARGKPRPELLIWPETALQFVLPTTLKDARPMLGSLTTPLLFGGLGHRVVGGRAELFNSAFLADEDGRVLGRSDKQRLIPFAEYIPLGDAFPRLYELLPNSGQFTAAAHATPLVLSGHPIAALICYEDVLPGLVRTVVRETGAQLLATLSNDAWFGVSREPAIHFALSKLRAIEQRRYLVHASNSGVSGVIDPLGRVVAETRIFARANVWAEVAWLGGDTPYRRLGDWPAAVGLPLIAAWLLRPGVRRRSPQPAPRA